MAEAVNPELVEPELINLADGLRFSFTDEDTIEYGLCLDFRNLRTDKNSNIWAMVDHYGYLDLETGLDLDPVIGVRYNLSSASARKTLVTSMKQSCTGFQGMPTDFNRIVNYTCNHAIQLFRDGQDVEDIWPTDEVILPSYLIDPILPLHQPSILFGDGGAGKGHVATLLAIIAQLPYWDNDLGLTVGHEPSNVLYLDYESDRASFEMTLSGICRGLGINSGLKRLGMVEPVADGIIRLKKQVLEEKISFLIVDSLAPASGGNINEAEPAVRLYTALRSIPDITTLIIAHNSKDALTSKKSVYGSVFFTNLARSVWECRKSQEPGDTEMLLSLKHTKSNRRLHQPLGFKFNFNDETNTTTIVRGELRDTDLSGTLPLSFQIKDLLRSGLLTVKQMAELLEKNEGSIKTTVNRMKAKGQVVKVGDSWGLSTQ